MLFDFGLLFTSYIFLSFRSKMIFEKTCGNRDEAGSRKDRDVSNMLQETIRQNTKQRVRGNTFYFRFNCFERKNPLSYYSIQNISSIRSSFRKISVVSCKHSWSKSTNVCGKCIFFSIFDTLLCKLRGTIEFLMLNSRSQRAASFDVRISRKKHHYRVELLKISWKLAYFSS